MFKTSIKTVFIPWKCVIIKRGQLLLLPQVMEVSESKSYESFALLALFLLQGAALSLRPLLQLLSSLLPLPFLLLSLSLELLWHFLLRYHTLALNPCGRMRCVHASLYLLSYISIQSSTAQLPYNFCYYFSN